MLTVICHIYNEEILLPYWLKHHRELFDHGIIIDYNSTDNSLDIVREYVPEWDIIPSKNQFFDSFAIDQEVMEVERTIPDWKITLNCTEFILKKELKNYIKEFDQQCGNVIKGIKTNGVIIVEHPDHVEEELKSSLLLQKHYGFFECEKVPIIVRKKPHLIEAGCQRQRLLHKYKDGAYGPGRHFTQHPFYQDSKLLLAWFGLAPFNLNKRRKMQIYEKMSKEDKERGKDSWVISKEEEFDHYYKCMIPYMEDLLLKPQYKEAIEEFL